jgi:hypothetical protein
VFDREPLEDACPDREVPVRLAAEVFESLEPDPPARRWLRVRPFWATVVTSFFCPCVFPAARANNPLTTIRARLRPDREG